MSIRMPEARLPDLTPVYTTTKGLRKRVLICRFCKAGVSFVSQYTRCKDTAPVDVPAHFRLRQHQVHEPGCHYQFNYLMNIIARDKWKTGIVVSSPGKPFQILLYLLRRAIEAAAERVGFQPETRSSIYIEAGGALQPSVDKALEVVRFQIEISSKTEVERKIKLCDDKDEGSSWRTFYFEPPEYMQLFERVLNSPKRRALVAVRGRVMNVHREPTFAVMNLRPALSPKPLSGPRNSVRLSIWSKEQDAFDKYEPEQEIITLGFWGSPAIQLNEDDPKTVYRNHVLKFWPVFSFQVCRLRPIVQELLDRALTAT